MNDFRSFVEAVRTRSDIAEIIGGDVVLHPAGSTLKALSPFNPEETPSFVVWPGTQSWHDFSNGGSLGGDVFAYVQERDKVGFKEAVVRLAERAGIRHPNQDTESWKRDLETTVERREVEELLTLAATYYHRRLPTKIREESFKQHYGFTDQTVDNLQLGWADGHLFDHLTTTGGASRERALKTGLFVVLADGRVEDFFRDRLAFPYWRARRVVYFIARATEYTGDEAWEQAKYKKLLTRSDRHHYVSPTVRNDFFYNEDAVRGAHELLITEGVTDCISALQAGIACISPVTTRFRKQDVPRLIELTRHTKRVVICNDSEASGAGEAGAKETAAALWDKGREACLAAIPRSEGIAKIDVNELVALQGPQALREVVAHAKPYPEYLLDGISKDTPKGELDRLLDPVLASLAGRSAIRVDALLDTVTAKTGVRRRMLNQRIKELSLMKKLADATSRDVASRDVASRDVASRDVASRDVASRDVASRDAVTSRPQIFVGGRQLRDIVMDAGAALTQANDRRIKGPCENNLSIRDHVPDEEPRQW